MNIKEKFEEVSQKYDGQRRQLIPCFDDFYSMPIETLEFEGDAPRVLDIGSGTGLFASFVLEKYKRAQLTLVDLSEGMLGVAKERFAAYPEFEYVVTDYTNYEPEGEFDIIISALSIHHLSAQDKQKLYKTCFRHLKPGGVFLNADQVLSPYSQVESLFEKLWKQKIENSGIDKEELKKAYERQVHDNPSTLEEQLGWLRSAGFSVVDCVYKYYVFAVLYAKKM